ncbi:TfoX/Sxy family protein [Corallococcus silvisoli]|uniref:TfoX/Sxy family protein n=1 Tax=Corallococcus silvisoli TaxID=2697031 RepID=UPI0013789D75|nr:TfoX/Sxy family protein [Corallococcus silvisoli]NBD08072.1 competence protein TfoX [Corallococcus silvisoli]
MPRMDSFVEYTVELMEPLGPVQARAMFGGWGLYFGGRMFALIIQGQLYLKVDDVTRPAFEAEGCRPFVYESHGKAQQLGYWTPPTDAEDDGRRLLPWARRAVDAAQRAAMKKAAKKAPAAKKQPAATKQPAAKKPPAATKQPAAKKAPAAKKQPRVRRS